MHNTRRKPDNADTLIPSRQMVFEINNAKRFTEARDAYEASLRNVPGWKTVPPHHVRRGKANPAASEEMWPRGIPSEVIYNMAAAVGRERALEIIWFVTSILEDNPAYFFYDTKAGKYDDTAGGVIARACGFARSLANPTKHLIRKYSGASYRARY